MLSVHISTKKDGKEKWQTNTYITVESNSTSKWYVDFDSSTSLVGTKVVLNLRRIKEV